MKETNENVPFQFTHKRVFSPRDLGIPVSPKPEVKPEAPKPAPKPEPKPEPAPEKVAEPAKVEKPKKEAKTATFLKDAGFSENSVRRLEINDIHTVEELEAYIAENKSLLPLKKIAAKNADVIINELNAFRKNK